MCNSQIMNISDNDLVMLRLPNDPPKEGRQRHFNTWFRVLFIDNDHTFMGKCERVEWPYFKLYKKEQIVKLDSGKVLQVYKIGDQFCYSDNVTVCDCHGLCRNK